MRFAPVMILGKATRAALCTGDNAASGGPRAGSGTACIASASASSVAGWPAGSPTSWPGTWTAMAPAVCVSSTARAGGSGISASFAAGRDETATRLCIAAAAPLAPKNRQHFVHQASEESFFAPGRAASGGFPAAADATMILGSLVLGSLQSLIPSSINSLPLRTL
jgi:hypothetical protein